MTAETLQILVALAVVAGILALVISFYIAQQNTLRAIQPQNREMPPSNVWLQLIPLFNLYYQFVVVNKISGSIRNEIDSRMNDSTILPEISSSGDEKSLRSTGISYCVLSLFGWVPMIGFVFSVIALVFMVIYWVKLNAFRKKIEGTSPGVA